MMRRTTSLAVLIAALLGFSGVAAASAANTAGSGAPPANAAAGVSAAAAVTSATYGLVFLSPADTFTFTVEQARGAGALTVATRDCCIPGDLWQVDLSAQLPARMTAHAVGDGSTEEYSGAATIAPFIRGTVVVSYASGVDIFPAGMCVRFSYSREPGVVITAPPQAEPDAFYCA
jgi:hypothetical protein